MIVVPFSAVPYILAVVIPLAIILKILQVRSKADEKRRVEQRNAELRDKTTEEW
jgi:hypothetical protein